MGNNFICPRCGNTNPKYIGYLKGQPYCRFCISMNGKDAERKNRSRGATVMRLGYPLSKEQSFISNKVLANYKEGKDTLINAVCGAPQFLNPPFLNKLS